jgi:pimeloyl-ACP methyl ester carboxylesterase
MVLALAVLLTPGPRGDVLAQAVPDTIEARPIEIGAGSGRFVVPGGGEHPERRITVHYHRPEHFHRGSPVVMVIPGAGRNGDDYRDAWVEASEEHGVLVLSPSYPEKHYPEYWSYNLAGMTDRVKLELDFVVDTDPGRWRLDEALHRLPSDLRDPHELFGHSSSGHLLHRLVLLEMAGMLEEVEIRGTASEPNRDRTKWIFDDFDRIFERVRRELHLEAGTYDLFGHSAGGQILHRLALFAPSERLGRVLAANAGWYTVPTFERSFPYGLDGTGVTPEGLREAFSTRLIVFLGEEDDADETRGSLRRTPEADRQGAHRLARGTHFFRRARQEAEELGVPFRWERVVVPGVGHDYERMSEAAAGYLYGGSGPAPSD